MTIGRPLTVYPLRVLLLLAAVCGWTQTSPAARKAPAAKAATAKAKPDTVAKPRPGAVVKNRPEAAPKNRPEAVGKNRPEGVVKKWMSQLSLRQQVAQLVVIPFYGDAPARRRKQFQEFNRLVTQTGVGGLIVLNRVRGGLVVNAEPHAMAAFLNRMQKAAKLPLIVGGDFERGASMRMSGTVKFPHQMAYAAGRSLEGTRYLGLHTAREARAMGVHWIFAPDADVNNNADNPVIGLRSFSENADETAAHVKAYIEGAHSDHANPVLVCAKHFPGHGDTNVDSHDGFGRIAADRERLDAVELKPFRAAIAAGVDSVMTAHLAVPALEPDPIPVTISPKVMTDLLQHELKFSGIVTTDAMDMHGLSRQVPGGEAAVRAILAGVDVLLIPPNAERAIDAVVKAVESGRISRERIRSSVEKVLAAKVRLGLDKNRLVDLEEIAEQTDSDEAEEEARRAAEGALTLVKNDRQVFPLRDSNTACTYVLSERRYSQLGRRFLEGLEELTPRMLTRFLDASIPEAGFAEIVSKSASCSSIVLATFVTGAAYRGDSSLVLSPPLTQFVNNLIATGVPVGLISFGNPYLLRAFPNVAGYAVTFSTAPTSEAAMAKALTGEIGFRGRLPITIPGLAEYGSGIVTGSGR